MCIAVNAAAAAAEEEEEAVNIIMRCGFTYLGQNNVLFM